jgi:hypothetical protein
MTKPEDKPSVPAGQDRSPAREKDHKSTDTKPTDDQPGADGESSAGASEDTYD